MAVVYATPNDYWQSVGMPPAQWPAEDSEEWLRIQALLVKASESIRTLTRLGRYTLGVDGFPKVSRIRDDFKRAACATVEWYEESGDSTGFGSTFDNVSMIGVSFGRRASTKQATAAASRIAPAAMEILTNSGIFSTRVAHPGV